MSSQQLPSTIKSLEDDLFTQIDSDTQVYPRKLFLVLSHSCFQVDRQNVSPVLGLKRWVLMFGCCDNEWDVGDGWVAPFRRTTDRSCAVGDAPSGRSTRTSTSAFQWYQRRWVESKKWLFLLLEGYPWDETQMKGHDPRDSAHNTQRHWRNVRCCLWTRRPSG